MRQEIIIEEEHTINTVKTTSKIKIATFSTKQVFDFSIELFVNGNESDMVGLSKKGLKELAEKILNFLEKNYE